MSRLLGGRRIATATLVALVAVTMADHGASAASDLVYEGSFEVGGGIRLTLSPDRAGITSFNLKDVTFFEHGGCGLYPATKPAYFDPPVPIVNSEFAIRVTYGDAHHPDPYEISGTVESESQIEGVARQGDFLDCQHPSDELDWNAGGPVNAQPHATDYAYVADVSGGEIMVFANSERTRLTGVQLQNVQLPCVSEALDLDVLFDPPLELRMPGNHFRGTVPAFLGPTNFREYIGISATFARSDVLGGTITGGNVSTCDPSSRSVIWSATLVDESATRTPTSAPSPPSGLPSTGQPDGYQASAAGPLVLALLATGLLLVPLALHLRRR